MPARVFETASVEEVLKHCVADTPESVSAKPVTEPQRRTIIVVDDEHVIADTLAAILTQSGFSALAAYDGESAFALISARVPDLLITDICMPGMNGIELAIQVRRACFINRFGLSGGTYV